MTIEVLRSYIDETPRLESTLRNAGLQRRYSEYVVWGLQVSIAGEIGWHVRCASHSLHAACASSSV